jgi:hypothetical protein
MDPPGERSERRNRGSQALPLRVAVPPLGPPVSNSPFPKPTTSGYDNPIQVKVLDPPIGVW